MVPTFDILYYLKHEILRGLQISVLLDDESWLWLILMQLSNCGCIGMLAGYGCWRWLRWTDGELSHPWFIHSCRTTVTTLVLRWGSSCV